MIPALFFLMPSEPAVTAEAAPPAPRCLPDEGGFLKMRLRGNIEEDIRWFEPELACTGMLRPDGRDLRLRFAGERGGSELAVVFAEPELGIGSAGRKPARYISFCSTDADLIATCSRWLKQERVTSKTRISLRNVPHWKPQHVLRINTAAGQETFSSIVKPESRLRRLRISRMLELIMAERMNLGRITPQSVLPLHAIDVIAMRRNGATIRAIGIRYGVSHQAVHSFLRKFVNAW